MNNKNHPQKLDTLLSLRGRIVRIGDPRNGEDLYQEVCLKVLSSPSKQEWTPTLILRIARHMLIDMWRRDKRSRPLLDKTLNLQGSEENPLRSLEEQEERVLVAEALRQLSPESRELLMSDEADREAAASRDVPLETLRSRKKRAKSRLKHFVSRAYGSPSSWS